MAIDNDVYDRESETWRDENHFLSMLGPFTSPRVAYLEEALAKLGIDPGGVTALDVGCGGGLVAEEVARLGCRVSGIDPSAGSILTAREHAQSAGLSIEYREAAGESLPFPDGSFDLVYCFDVLEHVRDLDRVIAESARVLKPGGAYIYDTINRTVVSRLVVITLMQDWPVTSVMPRNFHLWSMFIQPVELQTVMARHGLEHREIVGLQPVVNPITMFRLVRALKKGRISFGPLGRYVGASLKLGGNTRISYLGYAVKAR